MTAGPTSSSSSSSRSPAVASSHTSLLLTPQENSVLIRLLGPRCVSLATAVVQIYKSESPSHHRWNKRSCGVACFVKDNPRRSYYVRTFDMDRQMLVFDQEVYNQFRYKTPKPYFHTFEADDCQVSIDVTFSCPYLAIVVHRTFRQVEKKT